MSTYFVFGNLGFTSQADLDALVAETQGMVVRRMADARSATPFPNSVDLEGVLVPILEARGFEHHAQLRHPRTGEGFEYDFWRGQDQVAMEIMGYRADDEVYKDILKFHVHEQTRVGVVWVPRWKWISGRRTDTNFRAAMKAIAFADCYIRVEALVALAYDWEALPSAAGWSLRFVAE
jgi:hypothetical protein